jgi:hypothetical protein
MPCGGNHRAAQGGFRGEEPVGAGLLLLLLPLLRRRGEVQAAGAVGARGALGAWVGSLLLRRARREAARRDDLQLSVAALSAAAAAKHGACKLRPWSAALHA